MDLHSEFIIAEDVNIFPIYNKYQLIIHFMSFVIMHIPPSVFYLTALGFDYLMLKSDITIKKISKLVVYKGVMYILGGRQQCLILKSC